MKLKLVITDQQGILLNEVWTDEELVDVIDKINNHISVYPTEEDLDDANKEEEEEEEEDEDEDEDDED
jgi:hypothetical protein